MTSLRLTRMDNENQSRVKIYINMAMNKRDYLISKGQISKRKRKKYTFKDTTKTMISKHFIFFA